MKLSIEVFVNILEKEDKEFTETECYNALKKIKAIIENDSLSEVDCVEQIVRLLKEMRSNGGYDFG